MMKQRTLSSIALAATIVGCSGSHVSRAATNIESSTNDKSKQLEITTSATNQPSENQMLAESIRAPGGEENRIIKDQDAKEEQESKEGLPTFQSQFGLPVQKEGFKPSQAIRCDAIRHLKTPTTYRRLDSYFRPEALLPEKPNRDFMGRDFMTGDWGGFRSRMKKTGIDTYGCWGFDQLNVLQGNLSDNNDVKTPAPNYTDQQNYVQLYGLDFYSELVNKKWKGGQLHFSFAWPETRPIWLFGNNLYEGIQSMHGNLYYDTGGGRNNNGTGNSASMYQGFRVFEIWYQQRYGKDDKNFWRIGNIYPWINFNRTILAAMFNFWTFDEPGSLGTIPSVGRGPIYPVAPLSVQWYQEFENNLEVLAQVGSGYYDPTGGIGNRRGLSWFLNNNNGLEGIVQLSYKGGTYSNNKQDFGLPWLVHLGWQFHTGRVYSNYLDVNGAPFQLTNQQAKQYNFNTGLYLTIESMLYRERGSYNKGLTAFFKTSQYFEDYINQIKNTYVIGLGYEGLIPNRNNDVFMVGIGVVNLTKGAQQWQQLSNACTAKVDCISSGVQYILEIGYSAKITPWMFIQPSIQYLMQPYGRIDLGNITTATLSVGLAF